MGSAFTRITTAPITFLPSAANTGREKNTPAAPATEPTTMPGHVRAGPPSPALKYSRNLKFLPITSGSVATMRGAAAVHHHHELDVAGWCATRPCSFASVSLRPLGRGVREELHEIVVGAHVVGEAAACRR